MTWLPGRWATTAGVRWGVLVLLTLWGAFLVTAFIVLNTTQSQSDACSRARSGIVERGDCR